MDTTLLTHLRSLVKPRIVTLLCITGAFSLLAAGGSTPSVFLSFLVAGGLVAASGAAFNCWYDRHLDRHMERTADRPLPSGRLDHRVALATTVLLLVAGTGVGVLTLPMASVGYMLLGFLSYAGLYTVLLKRRHWLGVVLGGSAGSFPVLAGWTAVRPLTAAPLAMALVVFAWTPAHAWALAYVYRTDFAAADIPTLPVVASERRTRRAVWFAALATVAVAAGVAPLAGAPYTVTVLVGGALFLVGFGEFYRTGSEAAAVRAFFTSNLFLATLFLAWGLGGVVSGFDTALRLLAVVSLPVLFVQLWTARPALRGVTAAVGGEWRTVTRRLWRGVRTEPDKHVRDNDHTDLPRNGD